MALDSTYSLSMVSVTAHFLTPVRVIWFNICGTESVYNGLALGFVLTYEDNLEEAFFFF